MRNYHLQSGGSVVAGPPVGGETMAEGVFGTGFYSGEYRRLASKDDMDGLQYLYGHGLHFQEVGPAEEAMIVVKMHNVGGPVSPVNLGIGGATAGQARVPGDDDEGFWATAAQVSINANPSKPLGILEHGMVWEIQNNTGADLTGLTVRTWGTDNPEPLVSFSEGDNPFSNIITGTLTEPWMGEHQNHYFNQLPGQVLPSGESARIGLMLDVWDWHVESATAFEGGPTRPHAMP